MAGGDNQRRSGPQSREWRQLFRKQFRKTKMCRFFPSGECRYGQDCPYAHDESEIQHAPDLTKTALCEAFAKGQCNKPSSQCQFAHGPEELRTTEAFSSSQLCSKRLGTKGQEMDMPPQPRQQMQQQPQQPQLQQQQQQMMQQQQQVEAMFGGASFMAHPGSNGLKLPIAMAGGQAFGQNMMAMAPPSHAPQLPPFFDPTTLGLGMKPSKRDEESPGVSTATPGTTQHADSFNRTPLRNGRGFSGVNENENYWKEDGLSEEGRWGEPAMVYVGGVPIGSRHQSPERGAERSAWPKGDQSPSKSQGRMRSPQRYPDSPDYCWGRTPTSTAAASPNQSPSPRRRGHGPVDGAALAFHLQGLQSVFGGSQQASQSTSAPAQMPNLSAWLHQPQEQQQQQQQQTTQQQQQVPPPFPQMMPYLSPMDGTSPPGQGAQWGMVNGLAPFGSPVAVSAQQ